jgi:hypothetical protein
VLNASPVVCECPRYFYPAPIRSADYDETVVANLFRLNQSARFSGEPGEEAHSPGAHFLRPWNLAPTKLKVSFCKCDVPLIGIAGI